MVFTPGRLRPSCTHSWSSETWVCIRPKPCMGSSEDLAVYFHETNSLAICSVRSMSFLYHWCPTSTGINPTIQSVVRLGTPVNVKCLLQLYISIFQW